MSSFIHRHVRMPGADIPTDSDTGTFHIASRYTHGHALEHGKCLASTWPCGTRTGPTPMWTNMACPPFTLRFRASCSLCQPAETTKFLFGCRNHERRWFRGAKRTWNEVAVETPCLPNVQLAARSSSRSIQRGASVVTRILGAMLQCVTFSALEATACAFRSRAQKMSLATRRLGHCAPDRGDVKYSMHVGAEERVLNQVPRSSRASFGKGALRSCTFWCEVFLRRRPVPVHPEALR